MSLASGSRLGVYDITAPIGEGGMGQVYRARDTRLDRDVAIKILPEAFAHDADRLARFQREAKTLASLNHPHIAAIYGLEESGGITALVMELVEGEDLSRRIARGAMPLDEALSIAKQIADALEAAHEQGIIHRDLKPANIKVRPDGTVKVLDFGLAKALEPLSGMRSDVTASPTITSPAMTGMGVILGTAAYMSPEQAKGRAADKRSDVWAFGCILFEMLTGRKVFAGETISDVLAAVLKEEPDLTRAPAGVQRLLHACLQKDPKRRLHAISDYRLLLDDAAGAGPEAKSRISWAVAAAFAIVAGLALWAPWRTMSPQSAPERVLRYTLAAPESSTIHSFAVSPDGHYVAIASAVDGKRQLWLRALDALQSQPVPGTEDATFPFWSPDSRSIGFFAQGKLKKIAASGGPAQSLCDVPDARGGSWSREDAIVFSNLAGGAIQRVPATGGVPSDVTKADGNQRHPAFLPDGRRFLYLVLGASPEKSGVYLSSLDGRENRRVLADTSSAVFAPPASGRVGHVLFVRDNTLMAQPFDVERAQASGDVFPIAEGVLFDSNVHFAPVTVSEHGVLLYASGSGSPSQIVWFDRAGKPLGPVDTSGAVWEPSISPDEKTIVFRRQRSSSTSDIWWRDLARGTDTRFTFDASQNLDASWSPNGDRIVFNSNRGGNYNLYQTSGSGRDELLLSSAYTKVPHQWSRDGRFIVYSEIDPKTKWDLWVLPAAVGSARDRKPIPFLKTEFNELKGQLSPDGRWMAYTSDESGQQFEVYVRPFPAGEGEWKISTAGGQQPRWRRDGKELFFVGADGKMRAVSVNVSAGVKPSFEAGVPVSLFETHIGEGSGNVAFQYDVTSDGKRFVVATNTTAASSYPLTVVVNWPAAVKK